MGGGKGEEGRSEKWTGWLSPHPSFHTTSPPPHLNHSSTHCSGLKQREHIDEMEVSERPSSPRYSLTHLWSVAAVVPFRTLLCSARAWKSRCRIKSRSTCGGFWLGSRDVGGLCTVDATEASSRCRRSLHLVDGCLLSGRFHRKGVLCWYFPGGVDWLVGWVRAWLDWFGLSLFIFSF